MLNHHLLWSLDGLTSTNVLALIESAQALKRASQTDGVPRLLKGKNVALLSDNHSSSAAAAFHRAATELGAQVAHIRASDPVSADQRDPRDTAGLLGQLYDAIECEGLPEQQVYQLDRDAGVPVFNGLGNLDHPTRVIADLMTMQELTGKPLHGLTVRFAGSPDCPAGRALRKVAGLVGVEVEVAPPEPAKPREAAKADVFCDADEGGRLPLRLQTPGSLVSNAVAFMQVSNQRHVLQAVLGSTVV